jgi:proteasome assembly chaperone (PAC2) family protein
MADTSIKLTRPWLVAVWPGMGNVALNAGVYLLAKLGMTVIAEFEASDLFDVEHVEVKNGLIRLGRRPRNRFFLRTDPEAKRDLDVFHGEAQPPLRVYGAATEPDGLAELKRLELVVLEDGHIGGLNGVLLGAAAEAGLPGACLLGEMPHVFTQLPFPKASLAILETFTTMTGLDLDLGELADQAKASEEQLGRLLDRVERQLGEEADEDEEDDEGGGANGPALDEEGEAATDADRDRIEGLFAQAGKDRSKAFELKRELDRLGLFKEYEDRFLDLFQKPG